MFQNRELMIMYMDLKTLNRDTKIKIRETIDIQREMVRMSSRRPGAAGAFPLYSGVGSLQTGGL